MDGFVCACGTGGTLAGVGMALKARNPDVKIGLADPYGAAFYSYYTTGELKAEGSSITEGIGQGRITANLEGAPVDVAYRIPDDEALRIVFDLAEEEGLLLGGSSGINVAGAIQTGRVRARNMAMGRCGAALSKRVRREPDRPSGFRSPPRLVPARRLPRMPRSPSRGAGRRTVRTPRLAPWCTR